MFEHANKMLVFYYSKGLVPYTWVPYWAQKTDKYFGDSMVGRRGRSKVEQTVKWRAGQ